PFHQGLLLTEGRGRAPRYHPPWTRCDGRSVAGSHFVALVPVLLRAPGRVLGLTPGSSIRRPSEKRLWGRPVLPAAPGRASRWSVPRAPTVPGSLGRAHPFRLFAYRSGSALLVPIDTVSGNRITQRGEGTRAVFPPEEGHR